MGNTEPLKVKRLAVTCLWKEILLLLSNFTRAHMITFDGTYATLFIASCVMDDMGEYKCVFENSAGRDETTGKVTVKPKPVEKAKEDESKRKKEEPKEAPKPEPKP